MNNLTLAKQTTQPEAKWRTLIKQMVRITVIYSILSGASIALMFTFFLPFVRQLLPHWWANAACGLLTLLFISPFLRAIMMKKTTVRSLRLFGTAIPTTVCRSF